MTSNNIEYTNFTQEHFTQKWPDAGQSSPETSKITEK